jgi:hypothetical protein
VPEEDDEPDVAAPAMAAPLTAAAPTAAKVTSFVLMLGIRGLLGSFGGRPEDHRPG